MQTVSHSKIQTFSAPRIVPPSPTAQDASCRAGGGRLFIYLGAGGAHRALGHGLRGRGLEERALAPVLETPSQLEKNDIEPTMASMALYTHCMTAAATHGQPCCLLCCTTHHHLAQPHLPHLPPPWLHLVHCVVPRNTRFCDDPAHTAHGEITRVSQDCERDHAKARV